MCCVGGSFQPVAQWRGPMMANMNAGRNCLGHLWFGRVARDQRSLSQKKSVRLTATRCAQHLYDALCLLCIEPALRLPKAKIDITPVEELFA